LFEAGVKYVEVSGRGGTSWSKVEYARGGRLPGFEEWGYPTVPAIAEAVMNSPADETAERENATPFDASRVIASGGIRNGIDVAKGIALGAKMGGAALPFFKAENVAEEANRWKEQLRTAMFLCGARTLGQMSQAPVLVTNKSAEIMRLRGIDPANYANRRIVTEEKKSLGGRRRGADEPTHYL
ncbi:MAG: alpha-hydroxy-acid oxidizing protein, partial [Candidatus Micrarchaeota archaeon]|nr:alpha-hydroxy-acid oxidizing protein [Candidatus Micrarchaeota archaeon]